MVRVKVEMALPQYLEASLSWLGERKSLSPWMNALTIPVELLLAA